MIPVAAIIQAGLGILDKVIPDPVKRAEAKARLMQMQQAGELKELEASMSIITAEAKSEHWIVASWRPITMLTFTAIIANNYILYPYLSLFWVDAPLLVVPEQLWGLLKIGLGGYVVGRSVEKSVKAWKDK